MVKTYSKIILSISIVLVLFSIAVLTTGCSNSNTTGLTEQITSSNFYKSLTAEEKAEFDEDLEKLVDSAFYRNLSNKEKEEIVYEYFESEKLHHEIKNDEPDVDPDSIVIPEDATEEEKAKLKQEKAYWETVQTIKDGLAGEHVVINSYDETPRKVLGVYTISSLSADVYVYVQFVKKETIAGVDFYSTTSRYLNVSLTDLGNYGELTYDALLEEIVNARVITEKSECQNINNPSHVEYFNQNKDFVCSDIVGYINEGYEVSIYQSWDDEYRENPSYLLKLEKEGCETLYAYTAYRPALPNGGRSEEYSSQIWIRACPEFWARLEKDLES